MTSGPNGFKVIDVLISHTGISSSCVMIHFLSLMNSAVNMHQITNYTNTSSLCLVCLLPSVRVFFSQT